MDDDTFGPRKAPHQPDFRRLPRPQVSSRLRHRYIASAPEQAAVEQIRHTATLV